MDIFLDARASLVTKWGGSSLKKDIYPVIYWQQFFSSTLLQDPPAQCILLSVCNILFGLKCPGVTYSVLDFYIYRLTSYLLKIVPQTALLLPGLLSRPVPGFCACPVLLSCWMVLCTLPNFQNAASSPPICCFSTAGLPDIALTYSKTNLQRKHLAALIKSISQRIFVKQIISPLYTDRFYWRRILQYLLYLYFKWQVEFQITN